MKDNPSAGRICIVPGKFMKVPSGGETGAVIDFAVTTHGESLADFGEAVECSWPSPWPFPSQECSKAVSLTVPTSLI